MIAFHRVKKCPLIIGILDRIKINSEQLDFHSASQRVRAVPHFLQIVRIIYVCFVYFAAIAQVWINLHRQNVFYIVMLWNNFVPRAFPSKIGWAAPPIFWGKSPGDEVGCERGAKSHVAKKISGRGRRRSRDEKGNHGVGDFRFTNISQLFSFYFFFQLLYFIIFFSILF